MGERRYTGTGGTEFIADGETLHIRHAWGGEFGIPLADFVEAAERYTRPRDEDLPAPTLEDQLRAALETAEVLGVGTAEAHILAALEWIKDE